MAKVKFYFDEKISYSMITDLWSTTFGRNLDIRCWKWRFEDNSTDEKIYISYIVEDNLLAGYYAVSPSTVEIKNKGKFKIALSNMTMTHPLFQGRGFFTELASNLYQELRNDGFIGVYGFANHNSHYGFKKYLNWQDLAPLNVMKCSKENFRGLAVKNYEKLSFESGKISREVIKKTEGMIVTENRVWLSRDNSDLIWRLYDNPVYDYYHMTIKQREETAGVIFFKYYQDTVDVMEFFFGATVEHAKIFGAGLRRIFEQGNVNVINLWSNLHTEEHLYLEKFRFAETEFSTYFGVIPFAHPEEVLDYRNWHYRFFDSDVF